jgi:AcrR family transcriptional regulator
MPTVPSTPTPRADGKRPSTKRREAEVIEAAIAIFHERGYSDTSVEEIANALGILKGSLYYYIDSKEDLLFAIVRDVHEDVERLLAEALEDDGSTPLERLRRYIRSQTEYNARNIAKISVYYDDMSRLSSTRMVEIRDARREAERAIRALVVEAQEAGEIPASIDPRLAGQSIFATVNWVYRWYDPNGRIGPDELADFTACYALHGLTGADDAV